MENTSPVNQPVPQSIPSSPPGVISQTKNQKNLLAVLMLVAGVVIGAAGGFYVGRMNAQTSQTPEPTNAPPVSDNQVACTMEAKQCPDGSYVGRTGPKCEFSPCPDEQANPKKVTLAIYLSAADSKGTLIPDAPKGNMYFTLPEGGEVVKDESLPRNVDKVKLNEVEYLIESEATDIKRSGGLCDFGDYGTDCTYVDETPFSPLKVFRVWKDKQGAFAINPQSIYLNNYYLDYIIINKAGDNKVLSTKEIAAWKEILKTLATEESPKY